MINTHINSILKSSSKNLITKTFFINYNSKNLIKQITKQYLKTFRNKTLINTKSFCEQSQMNSNNNSNKNKENFEQSSTSNVKNEDFISFGFKTVKKEDRQDMVNSVFANVAKR